MKQPFLLTTALLATVIGTSAKEDLFSGRDLSAWLPPHGTWSIVGAVSLDSSNPKTFVPRPGQGIALNITSGRTLNIASKAEFGDCEVHVEFCVSKDSNSGIYFMGRYEIQIRDSFGKAAIDEHDCGAIYQRWKDGQGYEGHPPRVNASKPPGEWQTFNIKFRAPRFDASGRKIANATFVQVVHNGQILHENVEVTGPTRAGLEPEVPIGPILIQGNHGPVAFRALPVTARK